MFILDLANHTPGAVTANCMRRAVGSVLRRVVDDEEREKEQQAAQDREANKAKEKATVAEIVAMGYGLGVVEVAVKLSLSAGVIPALNWPAMPVTGKAPIYVGAAYPKRAVEDTPSIEEARASDRKYGGSVASSSSSSDSGGDSRGGGSSGSSSSFGAPTASASGGSIPGFNNAPPFFNGVQGTCGK